MASIAMVDGEEVQAVAVDVREWAELQLRVQLRLSSVLMPFCGCRGHLATSRIGTQYFAHYAAHSPCEYATAPESAEHRYAKNIAAAGARDAGWSATVERSSARGAPHRWRADVLATRDDEKLALEIQYSAQNAGQYLHRHERYLESNTHSLWFVNADVATTSRLAKIVDAFTIQVGFDRVEVVGLGHDGNSSLPLREFVAGWLQGRRPIRPQVPDKPVADPAPPRAVILPQWVDTRGPSPLLQRPCPKGCIEQMSYSSILGVWVCMGCRLTG